MSLRKRIGHAALSASMAIAMILGAARASAAPSGEEVLDKFIEATGGKAAYQNVKTRVVSGTMSMPAQGISGKVKLYQKAPNLILTTVEIQGIGTIQRGYNGDVAWMFSTVEGARLVDGEEKAQLQREGTINSELNWRETYREVQNLGEEKLDGKNCYKLELTSKSGDKETRYYDTATTLLVQSRMTAKTPQGEFPVLIVPSDWKDVDGIKMPMKSTQKLQSMGMEQILTIDKVETNLDIPADKFDLPEDVKKLQGRSATAPTEK